MDLVKSNPTSRPGSAAQSQSSMHQDFSLATDFKYDFNDEMHLDMFNSPVLSYVGERVSEGGHDHDHRASQMNQGELPSTDYLLDMWPTERNRRPTEKNDSNHPQRTGPCPRQDTSCMASALKTLQCLHMPPSICLSAGADSTSSGSMPPRMADSVLDTNKKATQQLAEILNCSCSLSSQVQLVLTTICGKLTAWYHALVRSNYNGSQTASTAWLSGKATVEQDDYSERIVHQPITVGGFAIDVGLESKIRAQVIICELRRFENLVKGLSGHLDQRLHGKVGNSFSKQSSKSDETDVAMHNSLTIYLQKQLQEVKSDLTLIVSSG
jgi:hypothetical protein